MLKNKLVESEMSKRNTLANWLYREETGATLLEFAFVSMFLFALTFGIIDFSRAIYTASVVNAAAQEGARAGIVDIDEAHDAVEDKLIGLDPGRANITITPDGDLVTVDVIYNFEFITPIVQQLAGPGFNFEGNATMAIR